MGNEMGTDGRLRAPDRIRQFLRHGLAYHDRWINRALCRSRESHLARDLPGRSPANRTCRLSPSTGRQFDAHPDQRHAGGLRRGRSRTRGHERSRTGDVYRLLGRWVQRGRRREPDRLPGMRRSGMAGMNTRSHAGSYLYRRSGVSNSLNPR